MIIDLSTDDAQKAIDVALWLSMAMLVARIVLTKLGLQAGATEHNPLVTWAINDLGWHETALVAVSVLIICFGSYKAVLYAFDGLPTWTVGLVVAAAACIASIGVVNTLNDAWVVWQLSPAIGHDIVLWSLGVGLTGITAAVALSPPSLPRPSLRQYKRHAAVAIVVTVILLSFAYAGSAGDAGQPSSTMSYNTSSDIVTTMAGGQTYTHESDSIYGVAAQSRFIFTGGATTTVYQVYENNGTVNETYSDPSSTINDASIGADGDKAFVSSLDGNAYGYNITNRSLYDTYDHDNNDLLEVYSDTDLYTGGKSTTAYRVNITDGSVKNSYTQATGNVDGIVADGDRVYIGSWDEKIYVVNKTSESTIATYDAGGNVYDLATTDDLIIAGTAQNEIVTIDKSSGNYVKNYTHHSASIRELAEKAGYVAVASDDNNASLIDTNDDKLVEQYDHHSNSVKAVSIANDHIYTGSIDDTAEKVDPSVSLTTTADFEVRDEESTALGTKGRVENATVEVRNATSGTVIDSGTTDSTGLVELQINDSEQHDVEVTFGNDQRALKQDTVISDGDLVDLPIPVFDPDVDNGSATPAGGSAVPPQSGVNISIDVFDDDLPSERVNVTFYDFNTSSNRNTLSDHTLIDSNVTSRNGTLTVNWTSSGSLGTYKWFAEASDNQTLTNNDTSQVFTFTVGSNLPAFSNPKPHDTVVDSRTQTLEIDVNDTDFPDDEVNASFYEFGTGNPNTDTFLGSQNVTSNTTASTSWTVPSSDNVGEWYVVLKDKYGNTRTTPVFSFGIAGTLNIRDQDDGNLVTATTNLTVEQPSNTKDVQISDGTYEFDALDLGADESVRITINASGYYESVVEYGNVVGNRTVYLTSCGSSPCNPDDFSNRTRILFTLDDQTGNYEPKNTTLNITGPVNTSNNLKTLHTEKFGAANEVRVSLEEDKRVQLKITNDQSNTRILGGYSVPNETFTTVTLRVRPRDFNTSDPGDHGYAFGADWRETAGGGERIAIQFKDKQEETTDLNISVVDVDSGDVIESWSFNRKGTFTADILVPKKYRNGTYRVKFDGFRTDPDNNSKQVAINGSIIVGEGDTTPSTRLPDRYKNMIAVGFVLFVAALVGGGARSELGAVVAAAVAGMFFLAGWMPAETSGGMIVLALAVAVLWKTRGGGGGGRQGF